MSRPVHILHVDDDVAFVDTAAELLEREDDQFRVETVTSVAEGLDRLRADEYDCVVSDYDLPERDGLAFLEAVRDRDPDLPFILFTGQGSEAVAAEAISAGVTDYLQKSTGTEQYTLLANRIGNAVAARETAAAATQQRHRLEQILKTVPSCVAQLDREGQFVFANDRAEEVLGLATDELTERTYNDPAWEIRDLDGDPIPDSELPFTRVLESGEPVYDVRHTIQWPDGTERTLSVSGAPLFDGDTVDSVVFALTDITDRRRREERLASLHEASRALYEAETVEAVAEVTSRAADEVLGFDLNGVHLYDEAAGGLAPVAVSEATERAADELVTFDRGIAWQTFQDGEVRSYGDIRTADEVYDPETDMRSGLYFPLGDHGVLVANSGTVDDFDETDLSLGRVLARNATSALDRVRRVQATEALQARTNALMNTSTVAETATAAVDAAATILGADLSAYLRADGDTFETVAATDSLVEALGEAPTFGREDPGAAQFLWSVFDEGERQHVTDTADHPSLSAAALAGSGRLYPMRGDGLFVIGIAESEGFDRTDRQLSDILAAALESALGRVERESLLRDRTQALTRQNRRLDEFASVVAHDLRNPLQAADGKVRLARETGDLAHLDDATQSLDRMGALIDDLLRLAREGETVTETTTLSLRTAAEEAWATIDTDGGSLSVADDPAIRADDTRLQQVLANLLANAVDHGGPGVRVTVGSLDDGFYVADDGSGIPPDDRDQVFDSGYSTSDDGTGFGLAIVRQIAEAHGWTVSVTDSDQGGARFEITGVEFA